MPASSRLPMYLRASLLGLWALVALQGPARAQTPDDGVLIVDLAGEEVNAPRGWPLHFYWFALRTAPISENLVLSGNGGASLTARFTSPGRWWISPEETRTFPLGAATARVGQVSLPLAFVDPPQPPLSVDQDLARRQAVIGYNLAIGRLPDARREAEDWVAASPGSPVARARLGDVLAAEGRTSEAIRSYSDAFARARLGDHPPRALLRRANAVYNDWLAQLPTASPEPPEEPEPVTLEDQDRVYGQDPKGQWAASATASSEYRTSGDYSASRATGAPDVTRYGDSLKAWASKLADSGPEWLECTFTNPVVANAVRVRQVFNPGAIDRIEVFDAAGAGTTVFSGTDTNVYASGQIAWFVAKFPRTAQPVKRVRISLDSARVRGWNEIDAVQLVAAPALPVAAPRLSFVHNATAGTLEIADWPSGFVLQRATRLAPADWQDYATRPPVSIPFTGTPAFFRLTQAP